MTKSVTAEQSAIGRAPDGVSEHDMSGGWKVIVARHGERCATWYFHANDDMRIRNALMAEATRRFNQWEAVAS